MTTTARLLGHLEWLRANLNQTAEAEQAVYNTALRLRAETIKDRTPDAILPKTVRRQLRVKVDALIDTSREPDDQTLQERQSAGAKSPHFLVIARKIAPVTRLGARAKLFDGQAVEWHLASQPMPWSEIMAITSSPNVDKEAAQARSPEYRRRVLAAFKTILAASLAEARARTKKEKALAAECLEVGAAMLAHASDGLKTADARAGRRLDREIAARISGSQSKKLRGKK